MKLTPVERHILLYLWEYGPDRPANIGSDDSDDDAPHPASVSRSMSKLEDKGLVEHKGHGVYYLSMAGLQAALNIKDSKGRRP